LNRIRNERKHTLSEYRDILYNTSFFATQDTDNTALNLWTYILTKEKETTRQIAVMYFVNGMTIKEIAETKNLSISGVHKHLDKLRRKIRDMGEI
jgi:DNA-binding NarL/FixJ family response regulator